jgi:hypothetical protein
MTDRYQALLERAKSGVITAQEVSLVAAELRDSTSEADPYTLLHIVGHSGDTSYRPLVEEFLGHERDPMLARLALQILCDYWGDTTRYAEEVLLFLRGVSWDDEEDVRRAAITTAGEHLRAHLHPAMLRELLRLFEDEREAQIIRESAYCALARAAGRDWGELPSAGRHFDLFTGIDSSVPLEARRRLAEQG